MFPLKRQQMIMDIMLEEKLVKLPVLAKRLNISIETVRRDVQTLVSEDKVEKVYGGIKLKEHVLGESLIEQRLSSNLVAKRMIAKKCCALIQEGECIFLDSGSTTLQFVQYLKSFKHLTVVTNSLPVVMELLGSHIEVIIIGGKIRHSEQSITTYEFLFNFDRLNISKAFICASGVSLENGISDFSFEETLTRRKIIEISNETYLACDHSKFDKDVMVQICSLTDVTAIVTDNNLPEATEKRFIENGIALIVAKS